MDKVTITGTAVGLVLMSVAFMAQSCTLHTSHALKKQMWHCTSYDYNADMCIQYSKREEK